MKERNYEDDKHNREDASDHVEKTKDDHENEEKDDHPETHKEAKVSNHIGEINENEGLGARKSSRIKRNRMVITEEEIGDCDDINDPDYNE